MATPKPYISLAKSGQLQIQNNNDLIPHRTFMGSNTASPTPSDNLLPSYVYSHSVKLPGMDLPRFQQLSQNNTNAKGKQTKRKQTKRKPTKRKPTKRKPIKRKPTKRKPRKSKPKKKTKRRRNKQAGGS